MVPTCLNNALGITGQRQVRQSAGSSRYPGSRLHFARQRLCRKGKERNPTSSATGEGNHCGAMSHERHLGPRRRFVRRRRRSCLGGEGLQQLETKALEGASPTQARQACGAAGWEAAMLPSV